MGVCEAVLDSESGVASELRTVHRLKEEVTEIEVGEALGRCALLREDELTGSNKTPDTARKQADSGVLLEPLNALGS